MRCALPYRSSMNTLTVQCFFFLCVRNCEQWTEVVYSLRASYEVVANIHRNAEWTWKMLVFFLLLVLLFIIRENWSRPITINFSSCVPFLTKYFCETKKKWIQSIKVNIQKWEEKKNRKQKYIYCRDWRTHRNALGSYAVENSTMIILCFFIMILKIKAPLNHCHLFIRILVLLCFCCEHFVCACMCGTAAAITATPHLSLIL